MTRSWRVGISFSVLLSVINYLDHPYTEAYKQSMLETTYVLVIDSKNLLDTVDEVRLQVASASSSTFEQVKSLEDYDRGAGLKMTSEEEDDDEDETTTMQTDTTTTTTTTTEPTLTSDSLALKVVERVPLVSAFAADTANSENEQAADSGDQIVYENTMNTSTTTTSASTTTEAAS